MPYSCDLYDSEMKEFLKENQFYSYLDIGAGAGKYGKMLRDLFNDKIHITAVEYYPVYIERFDLINIYDNILEIKAQDLINYDNDYDVIILGDVIEHLPKADGISLISYLIYHCKYLLIVYPTGLRQGASEGNEYERHISYWSDEDFRGLDSDIRKKKFMNLVKIKGLL